MRLIVVIFIIAVAMTLSGCWGSDSGGGSSSYSSGVSGGGSGGGSGDLGGGGNINPEPATLALVGSGLVAYLLLRRRKK